MYIPDTYAQYTSKRVLTMEFIKDTLKIDEVDQVKAKYGPKGLIQVRSTLIDVFGEMIFKHGHIHADAHPGNILI